MIKYSGLMISTNNQKLLRYTVFSQYIIKLITSFFLTNIQYNDSTCKPLTDDSIDSTGKRALSSPVLRKLSCCRLSEKPGRH